MHRCRYLLVALARTEADKGLLAYVAMLARMGGMLEVRFVHILDSYDDFDQAHRDRILAEMEAEVQASLADVSEIVKVNCNVLEGPLIDQLLSFVAEQQVDLILLGHQPSHPGHHAAARRLAMDAPCSVWMVPDGSPPVISRILVPVDFSDHAADTMRVATAMARLSGAARCLALHVHRHRIILTEEETHPQVGYEEHHQVPPGQEDAVFQEFLQRIPDDGVTVVPLFREGANVAHIIHRTALEEGIDLIIMSTRGRTRSAAILLGSVTDELMLDTRIPLLVVKHFGAQRRLLDVLLDWAFGIGKK